MLVNNYMSTSEIGQRHSVRSQFSKFDTVRNQVISDYISSFPESLSEADREIADTKWRVPHTE